MGKVSKIAKRRDAEIEAANRAKAIAAGVVDTGYSDEVSEEAGGNAAVG
jgi:hypothetical protein